MLDRTYFVFWGGGSQRNIDMVRTIDALSDLGPSGTGAPSTACALEDIWRHRNLGTKGTLWCHQDVGGAIEASWEEPVVAGAGHRHWCPMVQLVGGGSAPGGARV